jgi:hypothetical protein
MVCGCVCVVGRWGVRVDLVCERVMEREREGGREREREMGGVMDIGHGKHGPHTRHTHHACQKRTPNPSPQTI